MTKQKEKLTERRRHNMWKVQITVSGILDDEYEDTIKSIVTTIEGMELQVHVGFGEEDEE